MKQFLAAIVALAAFGFLAAARGADDPTGTWKWTSTRGNNTIESTAKLKLDGDKLTGVYLRRDNTETPITNASFKDNTVKFDVVIDVGGNKFTIKYSGTISGDTIKGKSSFDRDGQAQERDWEAKRQK